MKLVLRSTGPTGTEERQLAEGTLTLGRGLENDWVISDPERTLSKFHCRIDSSGDGYVVTDQSTNGVFVNDSPQPIGRGRSQTLADGDVVTLGPVHLAVTIDDAQSAAAAAPLAALPAGAFDNDIDAPLPSVSPGSGGAHPTAHGSLPFSGRPHSPDSPIAAPAGEPWLEAIPGGEFGPDRHVRAQGWETPLDPAAYAASGVRTEAHPLDAAPVEFSHGSEHAAATATVVRLPTTIQPATLPTDWNDADPLTGAVLAPSPLQALDDARPGQAPATPRTINAAPAAKPEAIIPDEDCLAPAASLILTASPPVGTPRPTAPSPLDGPPTNPDLLPVLEPIQTMPFSAVAPASAAAPPPFAPLIPAPIPPMAASSLPAVKLPADPAMPGSFLDTFLEGAGLTREALDGLNEAEMGRNLGRMVRDAVEGVRDILATRAIVKSELRVSQTIIQAADNSALKFAPDVRRCLAAMVGQPPQGFLPGSEAMLGALDDIKRHELALIAAINSVFAGLTEKLDPEVIVGKVRGESGIGNMLPFAREARCWAVYLEQYRAFQTTESENTAGSLLAPLAAAYARQLGRNDAPAPSKPT